MILINEPETLPGLGPYKKVILYDKNKLHVILMLICVNVSINI